MSDAILTAEQIAECVCKAARGQWDYVKGQLNALKSHEALRQQVATLTAENEKLKAEVAELRAKMSGADARI